MKSIQLKLKLKMQFIKSIQIDFSFPIQSLDITPKIDIKLPVSKVFFIHISTSGINKVDKKCIYNQANNNE